MRYILLILSLTVNIFAVPDDGTVTHNGDGTYYDDGLLPNCSFPLDERPLYNGAMNATEYDSSRVCGAYVKVKGPNGEIIVLIDNKCPECAVGDIDLSSDAFNQIADSVDGRVNISWNYVEGPDSPIIYQFKEGSNQWHLEILVKNIKYAIKSLEIKVNDSWINLSRKNYNYFVYDGDIGTSSIVRLRAEDINDQQVVDSVDVGYDLSSNLPKVVSVKGNEQFPSLGSTTTKINGDDLSKINILGIGGNKIKVAPSPVVEGANIIYSVKNRGVVKITIYDINSNAIDSKNYIDQLGDNFVIDDWNVFNKLNKGIYFVELKLNNNRVGLFRFYKI